MNTLPLLDRTTLVNVKPPKHDLTGRRFGRLTVISLHSLRTNSKKQTRWQCQCDCGITSIVLRHNLVSGKTLSCGCYHRHAVAQRNLRHGHATRDHISGPYISGTYTAWISMRARVRGTSGNPKRYKDRGIKCTSRWLSFENFLADMGERPSPAHSLDRKNNDKGYNKRNCRWATSKEQAQNRSTNHRVTIFGETLTLAQWSERSGGAVTPSAILWRLKHGWTKEQAVR